MSNLRNRVQLIGHLGAAPEVKTTQSGKKVANFSLAVNESYKNSNGEKVENTEWFDCEAWEGLAGIAEQYMEKGKKVSIEGKLSIRKYENKDGITVKTPLIRVSEIELG